MDKTSIKGRDMYSTVDGQMLASVSCNRLSDTTDGNELTGTPNVVANATFFVEHNVLSTAYLFSVSR